MIGEPIHHFTVPAKFDSLCDPEVLEKAQASGGPIGYFVRNVAPIAEFGARGVKVDPNIFKRVGRA